MNNDHELESLRHQVEQLEAIVDKLERRIFNLENPIDWAEIADPTPLEQGQTKCSHCGLVWEGVMGYVCGYTDCPMHTKITCG